MKKINKKILILDIILLFLITLVIVGFSLFQFEKKRYNNNIKEIWYGTNDTILLEYKGETLNLSDYSNDSFTLLLNYAERSFYFKTIEKELYIKIIVPEKVEIEIYPHDEESFLLKMKEQGGITRKYILSGTGDFNSLLKNLYETTNNDIFL